VRRVGMLDNYERHAAVRRQLGYQFPEGLQTTRGSNYTNCEQRRSYRLVRSVAHPGVLHARPVLQRILSALTDMAR